MNNLNWNHVHAFLTVSRLGSLSAAARELDVSQPTLSRDIQALESSTQLNLFKRTTQGLILTDAGHRLVDAAAQMDDAADRFGRQVSGLAEELTGDVRISVNEIVGIFLLPPAIAAFRELHPGVHVEVVISNRVSSLNKREADIALRMFQPTQPDLVARRLPDMPLGFYAHRDYLQRHGRPERFEDLLQHIVIGFDHDTDFIDGAQQFGYQFTRDQFALRTDHLLMQINLARSGAGIFVTHSGLGARWPELEPILESVPLPALEFWIVCHGDVQFNARIRTFMQFLTLWFASDPYQHVML